MGLSYSAGAFYGTWVARDSKVGKRLRELADAEHVKGHPQVRLGYAGAVNGDPCWVTIQLRDPSPSFNKYDAIDPPTPLGPQCLGTIEAALRTLRIDPKDVAPIGWYFAGTVD